MLNAKMPRLTSVTPILSVKDVRASIAYYTKKLGFESSWTWDEAAGFGGVCCGDIEIFFCKDNQGNPGTWLSIWTDDVDALYEVYKTTGAIVREPPTTKPWSVREMNVEDLDGHRIRFSMSTHKHP